MGEMRGGLSGSSLFKLFFGKLLVPIIVSDGGTDGDGGRGSILQLLPSGVAISGIVPFVSTVVAYERSFKL
jgi:hypothetical protein